MLQILFVGSRFLIVFVDQDSRQCVFAYLHCSQYRFVQLYGRHFGRDHVCPTFGVAVLRTTAACATLSFVSTAKMIMMH
jgi:hypothetical protein